jgi:hypothetical protein
MAVEFISAFVFLARFNWWSNKTNLHRKISHKFKKQRQEKFPAAV